MTDSQPGRGVLDGAFAVLDALPHATPPHQVRDIAAIAELPRATVYRLLGQLCELGVVECSGGHYRLGRALLMLARQVEPTDGLRDAAAPVMHALRERTGATVSLIAQSDSSATILETVPGIDELPIGIFEGRLLPAHAAGSLVIDPRPAPERVDHSRRTARDDQAIICGLSCFAAPIRLPDGGLAALQVSGIPEHHAAHDEAETLAAAARIRLALRSK